MALVWASHGQPILGGQIRVIVACRVFGTCRACVSCASGRIWALDRGGLVFRHNPRLRASRTRQSATKRPRFGRDSRERCLLMAASSRQYLLFMPRLRGLLGVRVTPRLHATNSPWSPRFICFSAQQPSSSPIHPQHSDALAAPVHVALFLSFPHILRHSVCVNLS